MWQRPASAQPAPAHDPRVVAHAGDERPHLVQIATSNMRLHVQDTLWCEQRKAFNRRVHVVLKTMRLARVQGPRDQARAEPQILVQGLELGLGFRV